MTQAHSVLDRRQAGVLLHISSLPNGPGNGDLGKDAFKFVDFLSRCGFSVWQTLPINPTHPDGSPYQCLSAHAGNPLLISLDWLQDKGWLNSADIGTIGDNPEEYRRQNLKKAYTNFLKDKENPWHRKFREFLQKPATWLNDFALFTSLREEAGDISWQYWPDELRNRHPEAIETARQQLAERVNGILFEQFVFFQQWQELRAYANQHGIQLFGDIPIFIASDSADVWANQASFDLLPNGQPRVVAGVPPDYFSATGQRWGNPHYRWDIMEADGFNWWLDRFHSQMELYDLVRIDHFRGLEAYWEIPADSPTALEGQWVKAPGKELLEALQKNQPDGSLPLIAENLGIITPEVEELRNQFDIPGMLILQFGFDGSTDNPYLPENHTENNVVYTGTHDNDTTLSWFQTLTEEQQQFVMEKLGNPENGMPRALVCSALSSVAKLAILPMQDILELGAGQRMNTPGTTEHNWCWRFNWNELKPEMETNVKAEIAAYDRH